ncbi:MAG TPA: alpha/beta fold hydrolase, partial [Ilumatobacteraceae bacterium]|nr:alpha/beta fold hydrolase [Ilumatobacteraceae bacterium]
MYVPWLPPGYTAVLPGRGEMFYRHHQHPDPAAPTVVLLHGWTASADLQFFTAYEELAQHVSFIAPDHRGHGRGMRPAEKFRLEDVADDVAALAAALGITKLIAVGYSMGGPIALLLNRAHPDLVAGLVLEATALEWRATRAERLRWKTVGLMSPMMRSWTSPHVMRWALRRVVRRHPALADHVEWVAGEASRNNAVGVVQAGRALSGYDARTWAEALATPS